MLYPEWKHEEPSVYHDETLPFDVIYHPDLWDEADSTIVEIKPYWWFWQHVEYCVAQISGYKHFKDARKAVFKLYKLSRDGTIAGIKEAEPPYLYDWPKLRQIALASDEMLAKRSA